MPKQYKIKRGGPRGVYKARPHPLFVLFMVVVTGGLVYLGFIIYPPIYNAIMNRGNRTLSDSRPQQSFAEPEPEPEPEESLPARGRPVKSLRAIYAPPALLADGSALDAFLDTLPGAGLNAVMVDIKDRQGKVLYRSRNQNANDWNAVASDAMDLAYLSQKLSDQGLALIVRLSAFRDETAARGNLDYAVNYRAPGTTWLDNFPDAGGKPWLNPYSEGAREYITDLALEAVELGAAMVVLDDFQFPPSSLTGDAYFGETGGVTRTRCLKDFADALTAALAERDARLAVYMTASALASEPNLTLYGGPAGDILGETTLLGTLPYQFADSFASGGLSLSRPLENPANTVGQIVSYAKKQTSSRLIALLQGGGEPEGARYTAAQIKAQIDKLNELDVEEFILYCSEAGLYQLQ